MLGRQSSTSGCISATQMCRTQLHRQFFVWRINHDFHSYACWAESSHCTGSTFSLTSTDNNRSHVLEIKAEAWREAALAITIAAIVSLSYQIQNAYNYRTRL
jgi:hypothetical protein